MDRLLTAIFLRLYARNLRRGWSGGVGRAWSDAIFATLILIAFPFVGLALAIWHLATDLFPTAIGASWLGDSAPILIVVLTCFGLNFLLSRKMRVHKDEPISSMAFNAPADRVVLIVAGAISWALTILLLSTVMIHFKAV